MRTYTLLLAVSTAAVAATASTAHAQVVTSAGGEVSKISQKNIVDRMIVADSIQIAMAQLAVERTKNAAVREFATLLITDHRSHLDSLRKIAAKPDVGREALAGDTGGSEDIRVFAHLRVMPADSAFDRAFVTAQAESNQRAIDVIKKGRPAVTNTELQQDIDRTLPVLEQHLARAKAVAAQLPPK